MLILTRNHQEKIVIGEGPDAIVITILKVREGQVRVGIEAPRHISVHREEIFDRINGPKSTEQLQRELHNNQSEIEL